MAKALNVACRPSNCSAKIVFLILIHLLLSISRRHGFDMFASKYTKFQNRNKLIKIIMLILTLEYIPTHFPHQNILPLSHPFPPCPPRRKSPIAPIRIDQRCISNARRALRIPLHNLRIHECLTDHPDESCQLYSHFEHTQGLDLYDLLLHEPVACKKPSILYDYSPPQATILSASEPEADLFLPMKRSPNSSQTETSVRKCTCSKTRCQKNYCQCFKQGVACSSACECLSCCNKEKLFSAKSSGDGRGCNCQKSRCQKNYCECHLNGKRCSASCKCSDCGNRDLPEDCLELGKSSRPTKRRKANDSQ